MIRLALVALLLWSAPLAADMPLDGQRAHLRSVLPPLGFEAVDVRRLSDAQVAQITHLVHSGRSTGDVRGLIRGALRPGFLQRLIDRR